MLNNHYDKEIDVIKYSKQEWLSMPDEERKHLRENAAMPREEALLFLKEYQKKLGYPQGPYFE